MKLIKSKYVYVSLITEQIICYTLGLFHFKLPYKGVVMEKISNLLFHFN